MTWQDGLNGTFETLGSIAVWSNAYALWKDKGYAGTRIPVMAFFLSWGFWNLYYYPHLNQWASFLGGISLALADLLCIILMFRYGRKK